MAAFKSLLCLGLVGASLPAWAVGVTFETKSSKRQSTVSMEGDKLRVEQRGAEEGGRTVLVDNTARTLTVLDPNNKSFTTIELARLEAMTAGGNGQMDQALSQLTPERRAKIEAANPHGAASKGQDLKLEPTGKKDKVAGYACDWYRGLRAGKPFVEACYIPFSTTGLTRQDFAPIMKTVDSLQQLGARLGRGEAGSNVEWDKAPGFPGIRISISPTGEKGEEERLVSLKHGAVPADRFVVPSDYKPAANGPGH